MTFTPLRPIKACHACGYGYTIADWRKLDILRTSGTVETRLCRCGQELSLDLAPLDTIHAGLEPIEQEGAPRTEEPAASEPAILIVASIPSHTLDRFAEVLDRAVLWLDGHAGPTVGAQLATTIARVVEIARKANPPKDAAP